eukprot:9352250-Pyramimonas_sp.AAC.1
MEFAASITASVPCIHSSHVIGRARSPVPRAGSKSVAAPIGRSRKASASESILANRASRAAVSTNAVRLHRTATGGPH